MVRKPKTIKCDKCGYDTKLPQNGFMRVIPPEGLKCPNCQRIILEGRKDELKKE